jgi:predicted nucleic acid-binding protein
VASLVDTNLLVYRFDPRDPVKQRQAIEVLRSGVHDESVVLAHQCIVEFIAAVTRPRAELGGAPLMPLDDARVKAERLVSQYKVLYPKREVLLTALRGTAMYGLSWFDAHLWAYAEVYGIDEILSEDFAHGRHYGSVRVVNPFLSNDAVHELPPMYIEARQRESSAPRARRGQAGRTA